MYDSHSKNNNKHLMTIQIFILKYNGVNTNYPNRYQLSDQFLFQIDSYQTTM